MNKFQAIKTMQKNGDSILTIKGGDDICATIDFSAKYIKSKRIPKMKMEKNSILVWSWTDDSFKNINVDSIKGITPLSDILKNVGPENRDE